MKRIFLALFLLCSTAYADELVKENSTSICHDIFVSDSSSSTGAGLTGLVFNTASLTCYYHRSNDAAATQINLVTMTLGTFTSSGFVVVSGANMPGWYQVCPPNAAYATGARSVSIQCKGAANMAPVNLRVILTASAPDVNVLTSSITLGGRKGQ